MNMDTDRVKGYLVCVSNFSLINVSKAIDFLMFSCEG